MNKEYNAARALAAVAVFMGSCLVSTQAMANHQTCTIKDKLPSGKTETCSSSGYIYVDKGAKFEYHYEIYALNAQKAEVTKLHSSIELINLSGKIIQKNTSPN